MAQFSLREGRWEPPVWRMKQKLRRAHGARRRSDFVEFLRL
jgi:hypothetical protein